MAKQGKNKRRRAQIVLLVLTMLVIWGHSMLPAEESGAESGWVQELLQGLLDAAEIPVALSEHFVRKAAHFSEYALLGLEWSFLLLPGLSRLRNRGRRLLLLAKPPVLALLTAFADETIQLFTPGRDGRVQDMWIDFAGAVSGTALALAVLALRRRRAGRRGEARA